MQSKRPSVKAASIIERTTSDLDARQECARPLAVLSQLYGSARGLLRIAISGQKTPSMTPLRDL